MTPKGLLTVFEKLNREQYFKGLEDASQNKILVNEATELITKLLLSIDSDKISDALVSVIFKREEEMINAVVPMLNVKEMISYIDDTMCEGRSIKDYSEIYLNMVDKDKLKGDDLSLNEKKDIICELSGCYNTIPLREDLINKIDKMFGW